MTAGKKLSAAERYLVARTYKYIKEERDADSEGWVGDVRDYVHDILGFATGTISEIWSHWCKYEDPTFASMEGPKPSGRPRKHGESLHPLIRELVAEMNKAGQPVSAPKLSKRLKIVHDISIPARSLRRVLRRMGMRFIKGKSRNILAESTANVAFRAQYLKKKLANLDENKFPERPEVYLDETFCNLHHVAKLSWVDVDKVRYTKSGRGPRFCIIDAGIIRRKTNGGIKGHLIKSSKEVCQANLKRKHDDDYHGNFNTEQFERWFENLCAHLADKYGPCNIHMDGASYHKNQTNPAPNSRTLKEDVQIWLEENGTNFYVRV